MPINQPSWDRLYERAASQAGHFTTRQAAEAGYSPPLLHKYVANGKIARVRRGVYRLVHFPASEDEDLVVHWLWSDREGVFSHETALVRHGLSDLLPHQVEMTVPLSWSRRRLRVPKGLLLHYADLRSADRGWHGPVPMTRAARTVLDCAAENVSPEFIEQAIRQGVQRGLFAADEVASAAYGVTPAPVLVPCVPTRSQTLPSVYKSLTSDVAVVSIADCCLQQKESRHERHRAARRGDHPSRD